MIEHYHIERDSLMLSLARKLPRRNLISNHA